MNGSSDERLERLGGWIRAVVEVLGCDGPLEGEALNVTRAHLHELVDELAPGEVCAVHEIARALLATAAP